MYDVLMALYTKKFTPADATAFQVWPPSPSEGFTEATVRIVTSSTGFVAKNAATLTADDGYTLFANDNSEDPIHVHAQDQLWVSITAGGTVRIRVEHG